MEYEIVKYKNEKEKRFISLGIKVKNITIYMDIVKGKIGIIASNNMAIDVLKDKVKYNHWYGNMEIIHEIHGIGYNYFIPISFNSLPNNDIEFYTSILIKVLTFVKDKITFEKELFDNLNIWKTFFPFLW